MCWSRHAAIGMTLIALALPATGQAAGSHRARRSPGAVKSAATAASPAAHAPRQLSDIHIEGEIPTPQVLFITARDQRRFLDFQDRRYLKTAQELADSTRLSALVLVNRVRLAHDKELRR
jgi:hypothetical protein